MSHIIINTAVAKAHGINISIILSNFAFWDRINKSNKSDFHFRDGKWWIYYSCKSLSETLEILTERQCELALAKMIDSGLIEASINNYNQSKFDQTKWYSLTEKGLSFFVPSIPHNVGSTSHNAGTSIPHNVGPIPDGNLRENPNSNQFSAAPAHGNINAAPASQNIRPNFKTKTSDDLREMAWLAWQETIKQKKIPFTEFELSAIKAYAYSKPTMPAYEIESNLVLLDKWTVEGLDIENSLRQSLSTKALIRPAMRIECDSRNNRIYSIEQLNNVRNNQIQREQQVQGAA